MTADCVRRPGFRLYLVTDRRLFPDTDALCRALAAVDRALPLGALAVQVREKDLATRDLVALVRRVRATLSPATAVLVNDRVDEAVAAGADGVHLPSSGLPPGEARRIWPGLVGVSTHSAADLARIDPAYADFATFGPVFDTPSKRAYGPPLGVDALAAAVPRARVPVFAIGGIGPANWSRLRGTGVAGVAVITAVLAAVDPGAAAVELLKVVT